MINMAKKIGGNKVLDLGCGPGVFLPSLSESFEFVYAVDIDISVAQKVVNYYNLSNVKLFEINIFDNSFDDNFFDIIFAASVLEHFSNRDKIIREIVRLLVPGGHLIFSSPTETRFYCLMRKMAGYTKPLDHYFSAKQIACVTGKYLRFIGKKYGPAGVLPPFALYNIYIFKK